MQMRHEEQESHAEIARVTSEEYTLYEPPDAKYGNYYWKVVVVREVEDETIEMSEPSEERNFWWLWDGGGTTPTRRPGLTPTKPPP